MICAEILRSERTFVPSIPPVQSTWDKEEEEQSKSDGKLAPFLATLAVLQYAKSTSLSTLSASLLVGKAGPQNPVQEGWAFPSPSLAWTGWLACSQPGWLAFNRLTTTSPFTYRAGPTMCHYVWPSLLRRKLSGIAFPFKLLFGAFSILPEFTALPTHPF